MITFKLKIVLNKTKHLKCEIEILTNFNAIYPDGLNAMFT